MNVEGTAVDTAYRRSSFTAKTNSVSMGDKAKAESGCANSDHTPFINFTESDISLFSFESYVSLHFISRFNFGSK